MKIEHPTTNLSLSHFYCWNPYPIFHTSCYLGVWWKLFSYSVSIKKQGELFQIILSNLASHFITKIFCLGKTTIRINSAIILLLLEKIISSSVLVRTGAHCAHVGERIGSKVIFSFQQDLIQFRKTPFMNHTRF